MRVNGLPLALGIRALNDRDEIVAGVHRMFFSTEELARVMPFPVSRSQRFARAANSELK